MSLNQEVLKLKRHIFLSWFACALALTASVSARAQAVPTATRGGSLQIGVGASFVSPDYSHGKDKGPTIYGTFDFTQHIGVEGDIHITSIFTPGDVGEKTYLLGPRYVIRRKRFEPYAKVLFGLGTINYDYDNAPHSTATYPVYAFGGGLDVRAAHKINVRAFDFEYQQWPTFSPHSLSPYAITFGVAYNFR